MLAQIVQPLFINNIGPWGLLLIAIVVLVLFGRGKIASLMGEVGKGITAFKKGVKDGTEEIEDQREQTVQPTPAAPQPTVRDVTPPAADRDRT
jgi:sec-independent protein translocase protein TatA